MIIFFILYVWAGGVAIKFIKHNVFHVRSVYIGTFSSFIVDRVITAALLGWIAIPFAVIVWLFGVGR